MQQDSLASDERFAGLPPNMKSWLLQTVAAYRVGDVDAGLALLCDGVRTFNDARLGIGTVFGCQEMDELCLEAGRIVGHLGHCPEHSQRNSQDIASNQIDDDLRKSKIVYLVTEIYSIGGHSRVIEDLVSAYPEAEHVIVVTDILDRQTGSDFTTAMRVPCQIVRLAAGRPAQKLAELTKLLDDCSPSHIVHLAHHFDAVATAVMQAHRFPVQLIYIHHADHQLAFGIFLPDVMHVDLHPRGTHICTYDLGVHSHYLPMVCRTEPVLSRSLSTFVTASCGSFVKFTGDAPMSLEDMIITRLTVREGFHVHVGLLPATFEASVRERCERLGIKESRFIYIPFVDDLAQALATLSCDLYIASFPIGGGKAVLEAMSAGAGVLCFGRPDLQLLSAIDIAYPQALVWRTADEFKHRLAQYDDTARQAHREFALAHFRAHHTFEALIKQWTSLLTRTDSDLVPPPIKPFRGSPLARFDIPENMAARFTL
ncbi:glycosyltransferase [Methylobacterium phyllostachyos]|uniref:glycosyltransferase n=1 Tax=Methylobacterium phyllostachyos TaxID=582672 RepID=UPI00115FA286|nr:glycosyltransferase [Methylobacterium phyllostachyos]